MAKLEFELFLCRTDNFGVLVHDPETGSTASIDAPEEAADPQRAAERRGWTITHILTTHHHHRPRRGQPCAERAVRLRDHRAGQRSRRNSRPRHDHRPMATAFRLCRAPGERLSKRPAIRPAISATISLTTSCFCRRHPVCARLRPAPRGPRGGYVALASEAGWSAGRDRRLFRP